MRVPQNDGFSLTARKTQIDASTTRVVSHTNCLQTTIQEIFSQLPKLTLLSGKRVFRSKGKGHGVSKEVKRYRSGMRRFTYACYKRCFELSNDGDSGLDACYFSRARTQRAESIWRKANESKQPCSIRTNIRSSQRKEKNRDYAETCQRKRHTTRPSLTRHKRHMTSNQPER